MLTSMEQLYKHYNISDEQISRQTNVRTPQQKDFISLVQWFGEDKLLPTHFDIRNFKVDHRFIPYGRETYGVYPLPQYNLYDDFGNLNTTYSGDRTEFGVPLCVVKFNKEEYTDNCIH